MDEEIPEDVFPLSAHVIAAKQAKDRQLYQLLQTNPIYFQKKVEGVKLIYMEGKIYIPSSLCSRVLSWYHEMLMHPGQSWLEMTIRQHLTWPGLTNDVKNHVNTCHLCKICKSSTKNYGHLLPKDIDDELPWHTLCVDLIGPYKIIDSASKDYELWAMTFIDPATGWFKIVETHTKPPIT